MTPIPKQEYIGLTEQDAEKKSQEDGYWLFHTLERDGTHYPISASFCINRLTVRVKDDIVIKAEQG